MKKLGPAPEPIQYYQDISQKNAHLNFTEVENSVICLKSKPRLLAIDLIGICNIRPPCGMCQDEEFQPIRHKGLTEAEILRFEDFIDTAEFLSNSSIGEPLLHPHITDLVAHLGNRGKMIFFNSNGLALTPKLADKLCEHPNAIEIFVSIDAGTKETYAKVRCNRFDELVASLKYYCNKRKETGIPLRSRVGFAFLPMKVNRQEIDDVFKLAAEIGINTIALSALNKIPYNIIRNKNGFTFNYWDQMLSEVEYEAVRVEAIEASKKYGVVVECNYDVDENELTGLFRPTEFQHLEIPCLQPMYHLMTRSNGVVVPCCFMDKGLGNWKSEDLNDIWNNDIYQSLRHELYQGKMPALCLKHPSCPVVSEYNRKQKDNFLQKLATASRKNDTFYSFSLMHDWFSNPANKGLHDLEYNKEEKYHYRWISGDVRLELPNVFKNSKQTISLHLRSIRPDIHRRPISYDVYINDKLIGRYQQGHPNIQIAQFTFTSTTENILKLRITSPDKWQPKDYFETEDARELTTTLLDIDLKRLG